MCLPASSKEANIRNQIHSPELFSPCLGRIYHDIIVPISYMPQLPRSWDNERYYSYWVERGLRESFERCSMDVVRGKDL